MTNPEFPENKIIGFFINQQAGVKRGINYKNIIESAQHIFYELNYEVIIYDQIYLDEFGKVNLTLYDADVKEILKYSVAKKAELVLCAVGGDGTFNLLINRTVNFLYLIYL
jgi:diacylglycerol kinase family enzyme